MSETIFRPQPGPQHALIEAGKPEYFIDEIFWGGSRGSGKTYGMLLEWALHAERYGDKANGIMLRRSLPELDDVIAESKRLFPQTGAKWQEQKKTWAMRGGGTLRFRSIEKDDDAMRYQGQQHTRIYFEELTNFPSPNPYNMMRGTLRSGYGVPCGLRATGNPGGPGHSWVKQRFIDAAPPMDIICETFGDQTLTRVYIPATIDNNPALLKADPMYKARLQQLGNPELVRAWLEGDWDISAGGVFSDLWRRDIHVVPDFIPPHGWYLDRSFDMGSSKPFAVCWWGEHSGEEDDSVPEVIRAAPRGTLVLFNEWYGWNGQANQGCMMPDREIAEGILLKEEDMGVAGRVRPGPADNAIFPTDNNDGSTGATMERAGVRWTRSDKSAGSRVRGVYALRRLLNASLQKPMESPGIFVCERCQHFIRTVPTLPRDKRNPEDVDTAADDHCFVAGTMVLMAGGSEKPIERIAIGDEVVTRFGPRRVTQIHANPTDKLCRVRFRDPGRELVGTANHPIRAGFGEMEWVKVDDLRHFMPVMCYGEIRLIDDVDTIFETCLVYNLTVDEHPEYYANGVLVHNCYDAARYRFSTTKNTVSSSQLRGIV